MPGTTRNVLYLFPFLVKSYEVVIIFILQTKQLRLRGDRWLVKNYAARELSFKVRFFQIPKPIKPYAIVKWPPNFLPALMLWNFLNNPSLSLFSSFISSCHQDLEARDFPGGAMVKNPPANAGDTDSSPGWGTKIPQASQHGQKKKAFLGEIVKYCIIKYRILF